ncbi:MAG: dTDP-4-amino-4,6-dideoxygalactose transaminase [Planctomycetes bacterium]|nr:dTDP-4-amino-4,6-dideoxygalactose transaminase [Planctomycetota bacterium]
MNRLRVPFNRPSIVGNELEYLSDTLRRGHISGDGHYTKLCHALLEAELGVPKVLLTTSCTHALEMCALLLALTPGDEVIFPSFAFVTTVNAFVLRGVKPVFVDVREDTLNLDERAVEARITTHTRGIVALHYAGVGCELDELVASAARHGMPLVEDNAHGLFGRYRGRWLGTFGALATQSFHETKNFSCGEGGALLINDRRYVERAEILRDKGTDRSRFLRGEVQKYQWVDVGSSWLPADLLAAYLLAQLERREAIQARRRTLWKRYERVLGPWAERLGARLPVVPAHCDSSWHIFHLLLASNEQRDRLIRHLDEHRVLAVFHYLPLHLSPMGVAAGGRPGDCPVAEDVSSRILRLPLFESLTDKEQDWVLAALLEFDG